MTTKRKARKEKYALYQRDGIWYISTLRISTRTDDFNVAQQRRDFIVAEYEAGRWSQRQIEDQHTVADVVERFTAEKYFERPGTKTFYRTRTKHLLKFFAGTKLSELDADAIYRYQAYRRGQKNAPAAGTLAGEVTVLGTMLKEALRWKWLSRNPVSEVKKPKVKKRFNGKPLSEADEEKLLASCHAEMDGQLADMITLGIYTGQRRGSLVSRKWEHIDFARRTIVCRNDKSGHDYIIPLAQPALEVLKKRYTEGATGYIFTNRNGTHFAATYFRRKFTAACIEAGIGHRKPHDLRHTTGTRLAELGYSAHEIAAILDHQNVQVTLVYINHSLASKQRIMSRFGQKHAQIDAITCTKPAQLAQ